MRLTKIVLLFVFATFLFMTGCEKENPTQPQQPTPIDPGDAPKASIDRFSEDAATLFVRTSSNGLPGANQPINFDMPPFITQGFGPGGEVVKYYNFDVQPEKSAPIFVLFKEGESSPVDGQLNIINVIPGDDGYNDFWNVQKVTVPSDYVANTVTSYQEIMDNGYTIERTNMIVNCPVVPEGSSAGMRYENGSTGLTMGWYKSMLVFYFNFAEKDLTGTLPAEGEPNVPLSDILVSFNINPGEPGGGPPSGFMTEGSTPQTHNILQTIPGDPTYSPFWDVDVYDNADFNDVYNYSTAMNANILATGVALVNCPVVSVEPGNLPIDPNDAPKASIDRFNDDAATLFKRSDNSSLPGPNQAIDFDMGPFITHGLGPNGEMATYYNFDVQAEETAPIYVLFREGESMPVEGQLNILDVKPGDNGYNDFWNVNKVTVPSYYRANTVTSVDELMSMGYSIEQTGKIVNCPIVPEGSTAMLRYNGGDNGLTLGWYKDMVVFYFNFAEKDIMVAPPSGGNAMVPISEIRVSFNINPGETGGGPPSGFMTEMGSDQTHNVLQTLPDDIGYSPYWDVDIYDNSDFDMVMDWASALNATLLVEGAALVNCPVVDVN